jgi:hypothetical protein
MENLHSNTENICGVKACVNELNVSTKYIDHIDMIESGGQLLGSTYNLRCWPKSSSVTIPFAMKRLRAFESVGVCKHYPNNQQVRVSNEATSEVGSESGSGASADDGNSLVDVLLGEYQCKIGGFRDDVNDGIWDQDPVSETVYDDTVETMDLLARYRYSKKKISCGFHVYKLVNGGVPYHKTGIVKRISVARRVEPFNDKERFLKTISLVLDMDRYIHAI